MSVDALHDRAPAEQRRLVEADDRQTVEVLDGAAERRELVDVGDDLNVDRSHPGCWRARVRARPTAAARARSAPCAPASRARRAACRRDDRAPGSRRPPSRRQPSGSRTPTILQPSSGNLEMRSISSSSARSVSHQQDVATFGALSVDQPEQRVQRGPAQTQAERAEHAEVDQHAARVSVLAEHVRQRRRSKATRRRAP